MNDLVVSTATSHVPALVAAAGDSAGVRFLEFFTAQIRNPHTRRQANDQEESSGKTAGGNRGLRR